MDLMMRSLPEHRAAETDYYSLLMQIKNFQNSLDDDHEVGVYLANHACAMYVASIAFVNPDIMVFDGVLDGNRARLVQHLSQLSFLLCALPKLEPDKPPRRIGF